MLHTVWAKKRLQSLAVEIENEERENPESVSLDLAIQEREWIEGNFGVKTKPRGSHAAHSSTSETQSLSSSGTGGELHSPASPKSPGRGPLLGKLKGLRLGTAEADLKTKQAAEADKEYNPLSPDQADVAVSWTSFASLNGLGGGRDALAAKAPQAPQQQGLGTIMKPIAPPDSVLEQQRVPGAMGSLNAFTAPARSSSEVPFPRGSVDKSDTNEEEDLFALPLSPRSPERSSKMFTFGEEDTARYTPATPQ